MGEPGIRTLWAIAKSAELGLTDEELHLIVESRTGKTSLRDLTPKEIRLVAGVLEEMKGASGRTAAGGRRHRKGNRGTENQRKKIYCLTQELGWEKPSRLAGMCRRMFGVDRVEWLDYRQCSKLIEALKSMAERKGGTDGEGMHGDHEV
jgi:phage gp16-like protein